MEGCPRSLMLKLDLKESQFTSLAPALKRCIREFHHEDGETYSQECTQLEQLRTAVIKPTYDNSGCNLLRRYYGQIHLLKTRFPMGEGSPASVEFTWTDLYTEDPITIPDISHEQSSILFNLGALHSLLGSREDRVSEEGMKVACTHYQSAAGAFNYIKENFSTDQYSDTSKDLLNLYINVMLGQAQECLLEKSMLDNRKNSLVARIAMQVQNYFTEAIACLTSSFGEILPPKMHKHWNKTLQIKCAYLNALAYMYMSNASDEQGKYGEKVAFLKIAAQRIADAQKLLKNQSQQVQEVVQFITDAVSQKLEGAKRDNDFIYHETEPPSTALPEIKGASLVKPIPFQPYDPSMGKDIFEKLIPMKAHETSSLYSEKKANLLRRYGGIVSEKDKELSTWLASMHIDDLLRPEEADNLPADLTAKCKLLQSDPGAIKKAMEMLTKLKEKGAELEKTLVETQKEIVDVQNEKTTFMEKYNVKLEEDKLKEYLEEVNNYQQKHGDAKKTNDNLEKAFDAHRENLELMIGPEQALHGILPSQNILDSPIEDDAVQRIRDLLAKIEKMKTQRAHFMDKLREQVNKDDITHLIATREGDDLEKLFKEELKKHDESCELLQCNLDAQEKIMKALTDANAKYAHARRSVAEIKAKRDVVVKSLIGSYDFFMNFKDKVSTGVTFYNQLSEIFEKRRHEITTVCKSEKERLQNIVKKAKQIKEEREKNAQPKVDGTVFNATLPERRSSPGNPQHTLPVGYQPPQSHAAQHPSSLHAIPHSLSGPAPNHTPPIQSGYLAQFSRPPCPPSNQPGMSQYVPRVPSGTLLTTKPIMSYPHPPFPATSQEGPRPPTSVPWQSPLRPSDISPTATGYIRFPPPQGIRPATLQQGPSFPRQPHPESHAPQGQMFQRGQVGSGRGTWQQPHNIKGPPVNVGALDQNIPSHLITQRPMAPSIVSHQPRPAGQPPLQQPPSHIIPPVKQRQPPPQQLPPSPARPETPPSPQKMPQSHQLKPPSYQQQFGIGSAGGRQFQGPGPQHLQQVPQQQPVPYQNPGGHQSHGQPAYGGQRPGQYYQPGPQSVPNQQSMSHQIPTAYKQMPPMRMPPPGIQHHLPSSHHQTAQQPQSAQHMLRQPPSQHLPPQQLRPVAGPQQPSGQYHQLGPYQQSFPYQPHQQSGASQRPLVPQQTHQQGPPPQQQGPTQQLGQHIAPIKNPPPVSYHQLSTSQGPHNIPSARDPQSYQKQPLMQKRSSENVPPQQHKGPYPSQITPHEPIMQEEVPHQTHQKERPANPSTQLPYSYPGLPPQTQIMPLNPSQECRRELQQPYSNQISETSPTSQKQQASQAVIKQQWQEQYGSPTIHQHPNIPHKETNKTVPKPNVSKPGEYFSGTGYPISSSNHNLSQTQQENRSSPKDDHSTGISKPTMYPSPNPSTQIGSNVTSTYIHSSSSHNIPQMSQKNNPSQLTDKPKMSNPEIHHSPSSQNIPPQDRSAMNTQNSNPAYNTTPPYFPAIASQASQPLSKDNQSIDNLSKGPVSKVRSNSFQEFSPTKVVLSKPGALSVSPLPANPPANTCNHDDIASPSTARQPRQRSDGSQVGLGPNEMDRLDGTVLSHSGFASYNSAMNTTNTGHLIPKPSSTIDDKLSENIKSLDSPQLLPPKPEEQSTQAEIVGPEIIGTNLLQSEPIDPGLKISDSKNPGLSNQGIDNVSSSGLARSSSQEDVHKLQQKVLLQQQQLIEQQQRFLEQQTLGEHSQVWRLMEQIKQQQKELEELRSEMKVKDQFGEIEKHLENLERRQNQAELKKSDGVFEKPKETESRKFSEEMRVENKEEDKAVSNQNKESKPVKTEEHPHDTTTQYQLSEITSEVNNEPPVNGEPQAVKEDFMMNQLHEFSLTPLQQKDVILDSIHKPTSIPETEPLRDLIKAIGSDTLSHQPPPKPSRVPQDKPDIPTLKNSEAPPTMSTFLSCETKTPILTQQSKMASNLGVTHPPEENQAPPPKPIKDRPPPPTPEVYPHTRPEVSNVTRDMFTKPTADTDVPSGDKASEKSDEVEYALQLAGLVENYREVVNNLTKKQPRGPSILTKEWLAVQHYQDTVSQLLTCDVGKNNTTKNRYLDILPYDQTRVILQDKEDSDYINATIIEELTPLSPKYIASQGPIPQCFMDFWLMVWQQKCPLIVMLTKEVEGKKLKCHQYWPKDEGHSMLFGSLRVTMKRQTSLAFWKERIIHITHNETHELHVVEHYQFTGWPDHGVPSSPSDFFTFMGHIYIRHQNIDPDVKKPVLLHCSAGVGRTGAFIVMYSAMREMYCGNGIVEVQELVQKLREKRKYMVQKKEQYEFCYKGILYCAEQYLIIENSGHSAEEDSSDSLSSSDDTYSFSSDDEDEYVKPTIPQRPRISENAKDISGTSSEAKQEGKKVDSGNLDSDKASEDQIESNSGKTDLIAQKCEAVSEKHDGSNSQKFDQGSEKAQHVETGNTFNNFLEICTKSLPHESILPQEINEEVMMSGGLQSTNSKISTKESTSEKSSSSKESDMGETKYKEITEEPEEEVTKNGNTNCENADCEAVGSATAVIPGLQEIQEGLINDYDAINGKKDDVRLNDAVSLKPEEIVGDNVEDHPTETDTATCLENDTTETDTTTNGTTATNTTPNGTTDHQDLLNLETPGNKEISLKSSTILPQEPKGNNISEDLYQEDTDVRTGCENNAISQELSSTGTDMTAAELDMN